MRCFIAIEIDERCRAKLVRTVEALRRVAGGHKWVHPDNMHLTLKFIGGLDEQALPDVARALRHACEDVPRFAMDVEGLGSFPPLGRPKVLFAGVRRQSGTLLRLAGRVEKDLSEMAGIGSERRRFVPHITLCRTRSGRPCPTAHSLSSRIENTFFGTVSVRELVLMQSELTPGGPEYTVLDRVRFSL